MAYNLIAQGNKESYGITHYICTTEDEKPIPELNTGNSIGSTCYVTSTEIGYIWDGTNWVALPISNLSPSEDATIESNRKKLVNYRSDETIPHITDLDVSSWKTGRTIAEGNANILTHYINPVPFIPPPSNVENGKWVAVQDEHYILVDFPTLSKVIVHGVIQETWDADTKLDKAAVKQETGQSTTDVLSQKAVSDKLAEQSAAIALNTAKVGITPEQIAAIEDSISKTAIKQEEGQSETDVMSQKAITDKFNGLLSKSFTITLTTTWTGNEQVVSNANFLTGDYVYFVMPQGNPTAYTNSQIYADDVTVEGQMKFHCTTPLPAQVTVNILRQGVE